MAKTFFTLFFVLVLAGCAGVAPVPGGTETVNAAYYSTADDFKDRVNRLQPGMPEPLVMQIIDRTPGDMTRLGRNEIVIALFGANNMQMMNGPREREQTWQFLQTLYGYKLEYNDVKKHHGFASPIRIRTEEKGFRYSVNLIFQNGFLLEQPVVSGGVVNDSHTKTFFDYLNPGTVLGAAQ